MSEQTWYVSRTRHKTLPLSVKGVIGLDLAYDAVPEDTDLMQFVEPLTGDQVGEHGGNRELLELGSGLNRVWITKSNFTEDMIKEAGENPDLVHGVIVGNSWHNKTTRYLADLDCPLIVAKDDENNDDYDRALLDGRPFFVFGGLDCFEDRGNVSKWYGRDHRLLKNGWSVRGFADAVIDLDDERRHSKKLYYVWPTPGRVRACGKRRRKAERDESKKLKDRARTWGLVFKDGNHLNVKMGNIQINRALDDEGDVDAVQHIADKRAVRLVKSYLADVFNLCAWRRLAGKAVGLGVLRRKAINGRTFMADIAFPSDTAMKNAIRQLRAGKDRWTLTETGKWRFCHAGHLKEAVKDIERRRVAGDKRRVMIRTPFGTIRRATFRRLVAAVSGLPLPDEEWFDSVVAEGIYRMRRKRIAPYRKEVDAFRKKQAEE